MEILERVSGARMHTALHRTSTFDWSALSLGGLSGIVASVGRGCRAISSAVLGLISSRVLKTRLCSVGALSPSRIANYGVTGVLARSAGVGCDLRLLPAYGAYFGVALRSFTAKRGDNFDRFVLRIKEAFESLGLIAQIASPLIEFLFMGGAGLGALTQMTRPRALSLFSSMEGLIEHFQEASGLDRLASAITYSRVESPKGEMGVFLAADGSESPNRAKVRTPVSHNMHLLLSISAGLVFGDFVATFCSLDIVLGEIDR